MLKRILLALAGTSYTSTAIRKAIEIAKLHDASITATTVVDIGHAFERWTGSNRRQRNPPTNYDNIEFK